MKQFNSVITFLSLIFTFQVFGAATHTNYLGAGLNIDTYEEDLPGRFDIDDDFRFAPTVGWKHTIMWDNIGLRTGVFGEWKKLSIEDNSAGGKDIDLTAYYLTVPANAQFNVLKDFSVFGGVTPRFLVAQSCEDCQGFDDEDKLMYLAYNFGVAWEFHRDMSLEVNFHRAATDAYEDLGFNTAQALIYWKL